MNYIIHNNGEKIFFSEEIELELIVGFDYGTPYTKGVIMSFIPREDGFFEWGVRGKELINRGVNGLNFQHAVFSLQSRLSYEELLEKLL